jgi:hypothetical protein
MQEQVFINYAPEDFPLLDEIKKRLELASLPCYIPPPALDPVSQNEMVEKIKTIASSHGCMLSILSNQAVSNSVFISNIQLMCESARTGRVLVNYLLEPLENDQAIRLFASQAYQVIQSKQLARDISRIIQRIHQVLQPGSHNIFHFLSRHISKRAILRLSITALVLGVGGAFLFNLLQPAPTAPLLPTPTPLVMYVPFSGQSQDAGLVVDARSVPEYTPGADPAIEAPFHFQPKVIFDKQDFNDPAFEHTYDGSKWVFTYMLDDVSSMAVTQTNGVLQLAMAPVGDKQFTMELSSKYLYNLEQVNYLAFRFRLEGYQGKVKENTLFTSGFFMTPDSALVNPNMHVNGISERMDSDNNISLGSRWHSVEMVSQPDKNFVDLYLDGKKIRTIPFGDNHLRMWRHYSFNLNVANTTDWTRLQIDEVIYGAEQPIPQTLLVDNAPYRFTPDSISLHEDFKTLAYQEALVSGAEFVTKSRDGISFRFPAGKDNPFVELYFPGKKISEDNYYAARFRFTSPDDNYWANWESLYIGLKNRTFQGKKEYNLFTGSERRDLNFQGISGRNVITNAFAYNQNAAPGNWHTLEMLIKPPGADSQQYTAFFWVDGFLLGSSIIEDPGQFLDANAPLNAVIEINGGSYRQDAYSGEINDLVIGTIASDKIKE